MKLGILSVFGVLVLMIFLSFKTQQDDGAKQEKLRALYSQSSEFWPKPFLDSTAVFTELSAISPSPVDRDSLREEIELGRVLFHDPRLSGSDQISCSSCHAVDLNWTDGRRVALGNDHNTTARNTPTIENSWMQKAFFWDGRAKTLEEQSPESISNPHEMNQNPEELPAKLSTIKGYSPLFAAAYGDAEISLDRITTALATFQKTIVSRKSNFDKFMEGDYKKLNDEQIEGLHLFRTKARCINCHNGSLFSDQQFHNVGLTYYNREFEDLGRYHVTHNPEDVGKFKTPTLRNVMRTNPWFHNGIFDDINGVLNMYNAGMPNLKPKTEEELNDPMFPKTSELLIPLDLNEKERKSIIAFLESLTTQALRIQRPELPH